MRFLHSVACLLALSLAFPSAVEAAEPERAAVDLFGPKAGQVVTWTAFSEKGGTELEDVWQVTPDSIVCKGTPLGYLRTQQDFTDFILTLEWRWPKDRPGKGGVLFRMTGEDKIWPKSLEAQINAGGAGDFWGLGGYQLAGPKDRLTTLDHEKFGKLTNLKRMEPRERKPGEWNEYEIAARGGKVTLKINGRVVNETADCDVVPGKICLTSEGSEIHFRHVKLTVLDKR